MGAFQKNPVFLPSGAHRGPRKPPGAEVIESSGGIAAGRRLLHNKEQREQKSWTNISKMASKVEITVAFMSDIQMLKLYAPEPLRAARNSLRYDPYKRFEEVARQELRSEVYEVLDRNGMFTDGAEDDQVQLNPLDAAQVKKLKSAVVILHAADYPVARAVMHKGKGYERCKGLWGAVIPEGARQTVCVSAAKLEASIQGNDLKT